MNLRKSLIAVAAGGVVAAAVVVGPSVTAGPAQHGLPQPSGERIELGVRAITGPDATKAVDCPGRNTAGSTVREAGVKETRSPDDVAASMFKVLAVPQHAHRAPTFHALQGGVEVERHVLASVDGRRVAVVVLTDLGDGLGVDFAIACVDQ